MSLKQTVKRVPGVPKLQQLFDRRTLRPRSDDDDPASRSKSRWRGSEPDIALTWGKQLSGEAFIRKAASHGAFESGGAVLEIGPGYGRLLSAALELHEPFERWVGIDLSQASVDGFNARFQDAPAEAVLGDAEAIRLDERFDVMLSSLTVKHIFPTFDPALANVADHLNPGGRAIFDLIEGDREFFERGDDVTYIRQYTREEVAALVPKAGLELEALDTVDHDEDPAHRRLLVVARKPG
jgi:SAM-dependent methyltransferase